MTHIKGTHFDAVVVSVLVWLVDLVFMAKKSTASFDNTKILPLYFLNLYVD